jgi:hypothetical protein
MTGDSGLKSGLWMSVDQKGSWPSSPGKGPMGDTEEVTTTSPTKFNHTKGRSPQRIR